MKKKILFFVVFVACSTAIFLSCKKSNDISADGSKGSVTQKEIKPLIAKNTANRGGNEENLKWSLKPTVLDNVNIHEALGCFPDLQSWLASLSPDVKEAFFEDYPWLKAYVIDMPEPVNEYYTSVFISVDEDGTSVGIIRKWKGNITDGKFTGELWLTDLNNRTIIRNEYSDGKRTSEVNNMEEWVENGVACKPNGGGTYFGHCTRAQFNAAYQRAKAECEGDFVCDIACSFNPCWVTYLTSAMIDCKR